MKRRDKQRAIIVIVHMILNVIYQMLPTDILCKYCMVLWLLSLVSLQYRKIFTYNSIYSVHIPQKYILHYIERKIGLQFKKTGAILIFGLCGITQFLCPFAPDFRGNIGERRQNHEG